ncbi:MAG TPA: YdiU family protein [Sphingomonas sp.]|jgi:uncharacterized protein YdiU (UPF0061 family)|uniref:protein adenylyltransferase SelO family protein n=1 Tax=Sphingomonas sp. TaxID=28214 RepID=UPI002ED8214E
MQPSPQPAAYRPERTILSLPDTLYDPVVAANFPETILRFRNDRHAATVGLDTLTQADWIRHFGRFAPLPGSLEQPLALRYHGHQFRYYNPDLGDGRGFLFAQLRDGADRLLDLGTKGSGTTPWSRSGDGRLTLKGGVREILATEMLEALGVRTSKTFSLIETGEALHRGDEPSPTRSAVLVRLSHGHIRIGSFQRLAHLGDADSMRALVEYCLVHLYGEEPGDAPEAQLLAHVARGTARLAASYMAAGFVHGVLNTDNIAITAESFDYGPWRFAPRWEAGFTAAYFDQNGLYAFGRQPAAIHWNVVQLAIALRTLASAEALAPMVDLYAPAYETAFRDAILARLGVRSRGEAEDFALLGAMEAALAESDTAIDRFFFDWRGGRLRTDTAAYADPRFDAFRDIAAGFGPAAPLDLPYWSDPDPCGMAIAEVEALWAPIAASDDWAPLQTKIAAIRRMGDALRG